MIVVSLGIGKTTNIHDKADSLFWEPCVFKNQ